MVAVSPANEQNQQRWMGRVEQKLDQLKEVADEEKDGSARYRHEMRERMESQDHSLAELDRDMTEIKKLSPIVHALRDDKLRQRGAIVVLAAIGTGVGWLISTFASQIIEALFH